MSKKSSLIFAVGDIHGCDRALGQMLEILLPLPYRSVFLGDYVDRGPSSIRTVDLLISAKEARPDWIFLLGNHEQMLRECIDQDIAPIDERSAFSQYKEAGGIPPAHQAFYDDLKFYWESDSFLFVHGGIDRDPHLAVAAHEVDELLWATEIHPEWRQKIFVHGHVEVPRAVQNSNHISLDTSCWRGGSLTAGLLDDATGKLIGAVSIDCKSQ